MKRILLAIALTGGSSISTQAEVVWQGEVFVTAVTSTCSNRGINVGTFYRGVLKPRALDDNGPDTKLSLIGTRQALQYQWNVDDYGNGTGIPGHMIGPTANKFTFTSNVTVASTTPAVIATNTKVVNIRGRFASFFSIAGCTAILSGTLHTRPDVIP
jgi:hypothetical protein